MLRLPRPEVSTQEPRDLSNRRARARAAPCRAVPQRREFDLTTDSADGSRCAAAADAGGDAHRDKNRNALSVRVAIYHEIVTEPSPPLTPLSCTTAVAPGAVNDEPPPPPPPPAVPGFPPPPP